MTRPSPLGLPLHEEETPNDERAENSPSEGSVLWRAVALRHPVFANNVGRNERAGALEDHICQTAAMRGELAELRLRANVDLKVAQDEWDKLQVSVVGKQTLAQAKAQARPQLAQKIKDAKWTEQRCSEEMVRMNDDFASASRAYTVLTGSQ
jgi:hypothetical protein